MLPVIHKHVSLNDGKHNKTKNVEIRIKELFKDFVAYFMLKIMKQVKAKALTKLKNPFPKIPVNNCTNVCISTRPLNVW